jgi:hypothetical protein
MILLTAAALFTAPVPLFKDTWLNYWLDFPRKGVKPNVLTVVAVEITVGTDGDSHGCRASVTAGNPQMAPYTCRLLHDRAMFRAARGPEGQKMFGVHRTFIAWWQGKEEPPQDARFWDFEVAVDSLPVEMKPHARMQIMFAVDTAGQTSACRAEKDDGDPRLAQIACDQLLTKFTPAVAKDRKGRLVPSVQNANVHFVLSAAPTK